MEFYDYKTLPVNGTQVIDPNKTGMSFYDQFLTDKELDYLHNKKNLKGDIIMMSPEEYYEACAKYGFPNSPVSVDNLKRTRRLSTDVLEHLKEVLLVHKKRFPIPMLNIAEKGQEGLHRMMVIGDLFGWNHKVPVLVVNWYDEDRAKREAEAKHKYDIDYNVEKAIQETCYYTYYSVEEIAQQLQHELFRRFEYRDTVKVPDKIELRETSDGYTFTFEGYEYAINKDDVELKDEEQNDLDDIDVEDLESTEDFLKRYFGDDWRETHPHLKDTFNIKESVNEGSEDITVMGLGIKLRKKAETGWTKETCHPAYRDRWSNEQPSIGQCAITAMWLNKTRGWDIYETTVNRSRHFFNKDANGFVYDLTADQFQDSSIDYENNRKRKFKELYRSCGDRYELFKNNLESNN